MLERDDRVIDLCEMKFSAESVRFDRKAAENIRENLRLIPDDRLLVETDSPYLAPVPFRGKANTPGLVALVAAAAAKVRETTVEALAELTTRNAMSFYHLDEAEFMK